ncbi:MAG: sialidase family protein [Candidatus Hydrogenedentota bacterium]
MASKTAMVFAFALIFCIATNAEDTEKPIDILRTPNGGIQPRAAVDQQGTIHLVYFKSKGAGGNLFYATRAIDAPEWSEPIRVNTTDKNVPRTGSLSLAQIALGKSGRVHITWFDMRAEKYWYARTNDAKDAFKEQRNLVEENYRGVEAGAAITADGKGNVYLVWHAGNLSNESRRGVYLRKSEDDGDTFGPETQVDLDKKGVCGCCALSALVDHNNVLYISYRAAGKGVHRDMTLLKSTDGGENFSAQTINAWELASCPVTITRVQAKLGGGAIVAFESREQAYFADVSDLSNPVSVGLPPAVDRQKNAALAIAQDGSTLLAWAEGKSWSMGGRLHWQVFDSEGTPTGQKGQGVTDMPRTTIPEAVALPDGRFVILY